MRSLLALVCTAIFACASHAQGFTLRIGQQTGDVVPGAPGARLTRLNAPRSSPSGALAFPIEFTGGGCPAARCFGVLHRIGDSSVLVARTGEVIPGANIRISGQADGLSLNDAGAIVFATAYRGGDCRAPACVAIVLHEPGAKRVIAWQDGVAPDSNGGTFTMDLRSAAVNNGGQVVFEGSYHGGNCSSSGSCGGIYRLTGGDARALAVWHQPLPGLASARYFNAKAPAINARGDVAVLAIATGGCQGGETLCFGVVVLGERPALVAWQGREAPGTRGGVFVGGKGRYGFGAPSINDAGTVVYTAEFAGGRCASGQCSGVFVNRGRATRLLASSGERAPGTGGGLLEQFSSPVALNESGAVAFHAVWSGGNCQAQRCVGIFAADASQGPSAVALRGQRAPEASDEALEAMTLPSIDDRGVIAFVATSASGKYRLFTAERVR